MPTRNDTVRPTVETVRSADGLLAVVGPPLPCGCYVLRFDLPVGLRISCGSFGGGKTITFEPGSYLYVGSAMAKRGALCLAGRLTRHANRLNGGHPHPILRLMLDQFPRLGLRGGPVRHGNEKRPKWNVDWPLDQPSARLSAAYAVRSPWPVEGFLARVLEADPATSVFERGLGAGDFPGNTHLLRVDAGAAWWDGLPGRLAEFLPWGERLAGLALRLGAEAVKPAVGVRLTDGHLNYLRGRWHERAAAMLQLMAAGRSFEGAKKGTEDVYDTAHWRKVPSRLSRGRGSVLKALANLRARGDRLAATDVDRERLVDLARELARLVVDLRRVAAATVGPLPEPGNPPLPPASRKVLTTSRQVEGLLTGCRRFLRKNVHDVPLAGAGRITGRPTGTQLLALAGELAWIGAAARGIIAVCRSQGRPAEDGRTREP